MLKQYDARDVILTWGEDILQHPADGTFVTVKYNEDAVTEHVGAQGHVTVTVSANQTATATITLGQASPSNDRLAAAAALQRRPGVGLVKKPFMLKHVNGTTLAVGPEAYIKTVADLSFGAEHENREWTFGIAKAEIFVGGSLR